MSDGGNVQQIGWFGLKKRIDVFFPPEIPLSLRMRYQITPISFFFSFNKKKWILLVT